MARSTGFSWPATSSDWRSPAASPPSAPSFASRRPAMRGRRNAATPITRAKVAAKTSSETIICMLRPPKRL